MPHRQLAFRRCTCRVTQKYKMVTMASVTYVAYDIGYSVQPQIRKSWDSMENANKKKKVVISKFTLTCISLQTI